MHQTSNFAQAAWWPRCTVEYQQNLSAFALCRLLFSAALVWLKGYVAGYVEARP